MPSLEEKIFFGHPIAEWVIGNRANNQTLFDLADATNRCAQCAIYELEPHSKHLQELLLASLYLRAVSSFQGTLLLAEHGMMPEAKIVLRALLETIFVLTAISNKPSLAEDYAMEDQSNRIKLLRKTRELYGANLPEWVNQAHIFDLEKELQEDIASNSIKARKTEDWAKEAELYDWYLSAYALLSMSVHVKVKDIEEYLVHDDAGRVSELKFGPVDSQIELVLATAIEAMLIALKGVVAILNSDRSTQIENLRTQLVSMFSTKN